MIPKQLSLATFHWKLANLPDDHAPLSKPFTTRVADEEELEDALRVIKSSYSLDPVWSGSARYLAELVMPAVEKCFEGEVTCIFVQHGNRVIGASAYQPEPEDGQFHLASGPCVLIEYRNRGLGTSLLLSTLSALKERGVSEARGQTRPKSPSAEYLYVKFGGMVVAPPVVAPVPSAEEAA